MIRPLKFLFWLCSIALPVCSQTAGQETLSGGDSHELSRSDTHYLFGDWGGERSRLEELGVDFDLHYISDSEAVDAIEHLNSQDDYRALRQRFGVLRNSPNFWAFSDRIHRAYHDAQPLGSGILDYNRLEAE